VLSGKPVLVYSVGIVLCPALVWLPYEYCVPCSSLAALLRESLVKSPLRSEAPSPPGGGPGAYWGGMMNPTGSDPPLLAPPEFRLPPPPLLWRELRAELIPEVPV